jgi:hypothetical protein
VNQACIADCFDYWAASHFPEAAQFSLNNPKQITIHYRVDCHTGVKLGLLSSDLISTNRLNKFSLHAFDYVSLATEANRKQKEPALDPTEFAPEDQQFCLQPPPPGEIEEEMMLAILNGIGIPSERRPLQCVTFKQPLPEYFRLKEACQGWRLQYSDVIRDALRKLIPVLESPNGAVREYLERHRESEIEKDRLRKEARRKRQGSAAPSEMVL